MLLGPIIHDKMEALNEWRTTYRWMRRYSPDHLELLLSESSIDDDEKVAIRDMIRMIKRELKARYDVRAKEGEQWERLSLPATLTLFPFLTWFFDVKPLSIDQSGHSSTWAIGLVCLAVCLVMRYIAWVKIKSAAHDLAMLGKVD